MILGLDVGNTNITIGIFNEDELVKSFRIMSKPAKTADEYGATIHSMLSAAKVNMQMIKGCIISSVVEPVTEPLKMAVKKFFAIDALVVNKDMKMDITFSLDNPAEYGADRIIDAVAAYKKYGGPIIVCDFGTANTIDYIDENGAVSGVVTAPGLETMSKAFSLVADKLPDIEIADPNTTLNKSTIPSMQAGILYTGLGQVEYVIRKMKLDIFKADGKKADEIKVVATGGLGRLICDRTDLIDVYDAELTLKGLVWLYEINCQK